MTTSLPDPPRTRAQSLFLDEANMVLATDLYQLTMMASYLEWEMEAPATFELFVRRLPRDRNFLVAAGLEQCIHYLEHLRFDGESIDFLRGHEVFAGVGERFFERLRAWRFSGDVMAVPEGTPVFANEPLLQVRAPLFEAQLIETYLLSVINFQTSIASKAARVRLASRGRRCVEFGTRRAHGPAAGVAAARASFLAGMDATSNVLAGKLCGIPVLGTAAHAFIMASPSEEEAFRRYHASFPHHSTLLIDTYDTLRGAERAAAIEGELAGVRLDSGDLGALARQVRLILDERGRTTTRIVASGDLDEHKITALLEQGAPIDVFGVGTELVTSRDHPALGGVYKLVSRVEDGVDKATMKLSEGKVTYPGRKQVWRVSEAPAGRFAYDVMQLAGSPAPSDAVHAEPLLVPVFEAGRCVYEVPPLAAVREHAIAMQARLPETLLGLERAAERGAGYEVRIGTDVQTLIDTVTATET